MESFPVFFFFRFINRFSMIHTIIKYKIIIPCSFMCSDRVKVTHLEKPSRIVFGGKHSSWETVQDKQTNLLKSKDLNHNQPKHTSKSKGNGVDYSHWDKFSKQIESDSSDTSKDYYEKEWYDKEVEKSRLAESSLDKTKVPLIQFASPQNNPDNFSKLTLNGGCEKSFMWSQTGLDLTIRVPVSSDIRAKHVKVCLLEHNRELQVYVKQIKIFVSYLME